MGAKLIAAMLAEQRLSPIRLEKSRLLSERACIRAVCGVDFRQLGICGRLQPELLKSQNVVDFFERRAGNNNLKRLHKFKQQGKPH